MASYRNLDLGDQFRPVDPADIRDDVYRASVADGVPLEPVELVARSRKLAAALSVHAVARPPTELVHIGHEQKVAHLPRDVEHTL